MKKAGALAYPAFLTGHIVNQAAFNASRADIIGVTADSMPGVVCVSAITSAG